MEYVNIVDRVNNYDKPYCWQYKMRLDNLKDDTKLLPSSVDYRTLSVSDFSFRLLTSKEDKYLAVEFIKRHEWLGTMTMYTTHYFGAFYKDILAGVITMSVPNSFSKLLGEDTSNIERLISRGACISWSPKCLASSFMMWCIHYMVNNTQFRLFTAYSDPTAKELGTIYQACNFYYLGNNFGTTIRYLNPYTGKLVSDRAFRQKSFYKKYAEELGIVWESSWIDDRGRIDWSEIPDNIECMLRELSKQKQRESQKFEFPSKHKYAYVLGRSKSETKKLRKSFLALNTVYDYPKNRGE